MHIDLNIKVLIAGLHMCFYACGPQNAEQLEAAKSPVEIADRQQQSQTTVNGSITNEIKQLTLGVFCGECIGHCATMYRYYSGGNTNTLWVDYTDSYFKNGEDKMVFGTQIIDINKYQLVNDIIEHIPDSLILTEKSSQHFGCPDCTDGCGIFFEMVQNKRSKRFYIDYQTSQLNGYIKVFAEYLKTSLAKLNGEKN